VNIFDRALDLLDKFGWAKFPEFGTKSLCLGLAMSKTACTAQDCEIIEAIIVERYPGRIREPDFYPFFNDHPDTTEEDVRLVLKLASSKVSG
jgi:hypothetical protein